ncbi:lysozyme [Rhizobium beringeri]|uniref:lysozyme n=1 Tax=Rhizobium beringeri TaxID=3019934 RepID=UPI002E1204F7|nr:lysozyme [Rhizobium beringeri]
MKISLTEAINIFRNDLAKFERDITREVKVTLSQNQFDELVSWHFNIGAISSATLTQKLNAGDPEGAAGEFERWNKSRGACLTGLSRDPSARRRCFAMLTTATPSSGFSKARMGARSISRAQVEALFSGG